MWYVIQTQTGREQELTECIERVLKGNGYRACFVIEQECVWRNAGELLAYQKPLFPSYVIADTDTPEEFFLALKRVSDYIIPNVCLSTKIEQIFRISVCNPGAFMLRWKK